MKRAMKTVVEVVPLRVLVQTIRPQAPKQEVAVILACSALEHECFTSLPFGNVRAASSPFIAPEFPYLLPHATAHRRIEMLANGGTVNLGQHRGTSDDKIL